jgi:multidrug efflux pump subunit AcrA (membrane-fusion protein)
MQRLPVRWAVITVIVLAIAGLGYWGVKAMTSEGQDKLVMATKPVTTGDIEVTVRGWGNLQAKEEQDVVVSAEGVVDGIFFQPGESVTKGQVLATIDAGSLSVAIQTLEITIDSERIKLARAFGVSPDQVADVDPATALVVRAPMDGTIDSLTAEVGSTVSGEVCKVVNDSRLVIKMQVPQHLFQVISPGTKVAFTPQRFDGRVPGVVTRADPTPIKSSEAYYHDVWIELENPGLLKVGDTGTVAFDAQGADYQPTAKITAFGSQEVVSAAISGRVKKVHARNGQIVKAGDPILEFEAGEALLNAMTMQLNFRAKLLELEDKKTQMQNLNVICPMDGVALERNISIGQQVDKGVKVTRVANYQHMNLMLRVDEMDVPKVQVGQEAKVMIWGPQGQQEVIATVDKIGSTGDLRDGYSSFNITLAVQNPGFLRPGMGGEAQIFVSKKEGVLLCPVEALYKEEEKWFVDVKTGDEERTPVQIEVGLMNDMYAEVLSGLTEGQEVVVGMTKDPESAGGGPGMVRRIF